MVSYRVLMGMERITHYTQRLTQIVNRSELMRVDHESILADHIALLTITNDFWITTLEVFLNQYLGSHTIIQDIGHSNSYSVLDIYADGDDEDTMADLDTLCHEFMDEVLAWLQVNEDELFNDDLLHFRIRPTGAVYALVSKPLQSFFIV